MKSPRTTADTQPRSATCWHEGAGGAAPATTLPRTLHRRLDPGACALNPPDHQAITDQASSAHRSAVGPAASILVNWLKPLTGSKIDVMTTRPELICAIG
jgi:hypothetical protein